MHKLKYCIIDEGFRATEAGNELVRAPLSFFNFRVDLEMLMCLRYFLFSLCLQVAGQMGDR